MRLNTFLNFGGNCEQAFRFSNSTSVERSR